MLADRMTVLHRGRTLQSGPALEITARPGSPEVARLVDLKNVSTARSPSTGRMPASRWSPGRITCWKRGCNPPFAAGQPISWAIPTASVILHRRDRPSRGERENPVPGVVTEFVPLGENASVAVQVDSAPELPLFMTIPTHVAERNRIGLGERVTASSFAQAIHLMPRDARTAAAT